MTTATARPIDPSTFDSQATPQTDFYRYVNGPWLDANPVPPQYGSWGAFHEVTERNQELLHRLLVDAAKSPGAPGSVESMVGDYFAAAMGIDAIAEAGTAPIEALLARCQAVESVADVRDVSRELHATGVEVLLDFGIAPDFEDANAYLAYVGQGGLGLPERDYYLRDDDRSTALLGSYRDHIAAQLSNAGDAAESAAASARAIVEFETRLASASYPAEKMRDVQLTLNRTDVASLDELMPEFGLSEYVRSLGVLSPTVNIDNAGFFSALDSTLAETPVATLRDYLRWHVIRAFASALSPSFENEAFAFYGRTLGGQQEMRPRWKRVLDAASADIGEQVARLFVAQTFSEDAKVRCERLVDALLGAMGRSIRSASWMTETTREAALQKLAGFSYKIGYPDAWRDYSGLVVTRDSYATNRMRAAQFEFQRQVGRLGKPVDKAEWAMPAHQVNAYYHPLLNEVVFPAGILQPPFFYADADDAVNFGAIGAVIGHEITHGFDDRGSHFDAAGSLRDWWTPEDRAEFDARAQVLVEQFDAFEVADDLYVNGRLTLGENIADLGGITVALDALNHTVRDDAPLIDGFTPQQRFFLAYAKVWRMNHTDEYLRLLVNVDPHTPAPFRVKGPLPNMVAFAEAFGVPEDAPMMRPTAAHAKIW